MNWSKPQMLFPENNLRRQIFLILTPVLSVAVLFFAAAAQSAQTKSGTKTTTTAAKKTPTPKPAAKSSAGTSDKKTPAKAVSKTDSKTAKDSKTVAAGKKDASKSAAKSKDAAAKSNSKSAVSKTSDKAQTAAKSKTADKSKQTSTASKSSGASKPSSAKPAAEKISVAAKPSSQAIVAVTSARVRRDPNTSALEITRLKLGTLLKVSEENPSWYKVQIPAQSKTGWVSKQVATDFEDAKREDIYRQIVSRTYKPEQTAFSDSVELYDFLTRSQNEVKTKETAAEFAYKRLLALRTALKAVPFGKAGEKPYSDFLKKNEKSVVYSEPAGAWYVRSEEFWNLQKKFSDAPNSDEMAWTASQNPLPGECEGYVNCYLFLLRETDGNYLNLYPNGKHAEQSLKNIQNLLEPIAADLTEKKVYNGPSDVSDRAEFNRLIAELRTIVSKIPFGEIEKQKTVRQLNQIAESYR